MEKERPEKTQSRLHTAQTGNLKASMGVDIFKMPHSQNQSEACKPKVFYLTSFSQQQT